MEVELQTILDQLEDIPIEEVPRLLGDLEEIRVRAMMRLSVPAPHEAGDRLIGVDEAAKLLDISKDRLYRHADEYAFSRREGRLLKFSFQGIQKHMRAKR